MSTNLWLPDFSLYMTLDCVEYAYLNLPIHLLARSSSQSTILTSFSSSVTEMQIRCGIIPTFQEASAASTNKSLKTYCHSSWGFFTSGSKISIVNGTIQTIPSQHWQRTFLEHSPAWHIDWLYFFALWACLHCSYFDIIMGKSKYVCHCVVKWLSLILWGDPDSPPVPKRPTIEGGNLFPCLVTPFSPCVPAGRSCCTLLGRLVSWETLTVFRIICVIGRKSSRTHGVFGRGLDISHPDLNEIAFFTMCMIDTRTFWPHESSRDLSPYHFRSVCVRSQFGGWEFLIPQPIMCCITWF